MAQLRKFSIDVSVPRQTRLRFTTVLINIGDGPLRALGHTRQPNGDLLVDQEIANANGTWTKEPTAVRMYFAGDGHNHWHLRDLETYVLQDRGDRFVRTSEKHGFCFFDDSPFNLDLPGAPRSAVYAKEGCGNTASASSITMGISVGWDDRYISKLVDQYIDITGLPPGEYLLTATADAQGHLRELCDRNNSTTAILQITGTEVIVVDPGKASAACV